MAISVNVGGSLARLGGPARGPALPRPTNLVRPPGLPGHGLVTTHIGAAGQGPQPLANRWTGLAAAAAQNPHMWQQIAENPHGDGTATLTPQQVGLGAPSAPGPAAPSAPAAPPAASPLDSTYMANVAANQFKVNNDINGLNLQGSQNDTRLQDALGQLAYAEPRAQLGLEQKANQSGGLYSSVYGQNLGDLTHGFTMKQSEAQRTHDSLRDTIAAQIAAAQGGIPLYNDQQAAESAGRATRLAANNPGLGQGTGGLNTSPKPPAGRGTAKNRLAVNVGLAGKAAAGVVRAEGKAHPRPAAKRQASAFDQALGIASGRY